MSLPGSILAGPGFRAIRGIVLSGVHAKPAHPASNTDPGASHMLVHPPREFPMEQRVTARPVTQLDGAGLSLDFWGWSLCGVVLLPGVPEQLPVTSSFAR